MDTSQLSLSSTRIGPLPIVNHFVEHLEIEALLDRFVPTADCRVKLPYAKALGVLLRSILVEREPIYSQHETVEAFSPECFGLGKGELKHLGDDRIGRALDRLFESDRGTMLTALAVTTVKKCGLCLDQMHTDATSVSFSGQYKAAGGRMINGKRAPRITLGYSKDHRPDLKQLLLEFSIAADGSVPLRFRCVDGNGNEDGLHIATWETLCSVAGRRDFLYVADTKLCSRTNMNYIDRHGGRFLTTMPSGRLEYKEFMEWIQNHNPDWIEVWHRTNTRYVDAPPDIWAVFRYGVPSSEGWPVTWVFNSTLAASHQKRRRTQIAAAVKEFERIQGMLRGKRRRPRTLHDLNKRVAGVLSHYGVSRYVVPQTSEHFEDTYIQDRGGRAGSNTKYHRIPRDHLTLSWTIDDEAVRCDAKMDGLYPLLTNDASLTPEQTLVAHKGQPRIEKRFQQVKDVFEIAPVFLKSEARIEAFFTIFFMAMVVQAVMERRLRRSMDRRNIDALPLYSERRPCKQPTADRILKLFTHVQRHHLQDGDRQIRTFEPELTPLQTQTLELLGMSPAAYAAA